MRISGIDLPALRSELLPDIRGTQGFELLAVNESVFGAAAAAGTR
jgi:hypothetical protein